MCDSVLRSEHLPATLGQVVHTRVLVLLQVLNMQRVMGMGEYHEEWTSPAMIASELRSSETEGKPVMLVRPVEERAAPELVAEEYINTIKEVYMIPTEVRRALAPVPRSLLVDK